jgi:hypothetical protein
MPVEIRELVIRATTRLAAQDADESPQMPEPTDDKQAIIQECVRQVLRILQQRKER